MGLPDGLSILASTLCSVLCDGPDILPGTIAILCLRRAQPIGADEDLAARADGGGVVVPLTAGTSVVVCDDVCNCLRSLKSNRAAHHDSCLNCYLNSVRINLHALYTEALLGEALFNDLFRFQTLVLGLNGGCRSVIGARLKGGGATSRLVVRATVERTASTYFLNIHSSIRFIFERNCVAGRIGAPIYTL